MNGNTPTSRIPHFFSIPNCFSTLIVSGNIWLYFFKSFFSCFDNTSNSGYSTKMRTSFSPNPYPNLTCSVYIGSTALIG